MSFRCSRDCDGPGCVACAEIASLRGKVERAEARIAAAVAAEREACGQLALKWMKEAGLGGIAGVSLLTAIRARGAR